MNKVGATTGRTRGPVTIFCGNFNVADDNGADTGISLLCNHFAEARVDQGDSGAPVVRGTNSPEQFDVELAGVLWGGNATGFAFSSQAGIQTELGSMNTCSAGLSC